MRYLTTLLLASTLVYAGGAAKPPAGACSLIPATAIHQVFGEPVTNAKPASQTSGEVTSSHCFYSLPTFTNSISVSLTAPGAANARHDAARELWQRWFHGERDDGDHEAAGKSEEQEAASKASPLPNLGDEAFWVHSFVGNLYVLKGNEFLRISIGGKLTDEERQERAQALARAALKTLNRKR